MSDHGGEVLQVKNQGHGRFAVILKASGSRDRDFFTAKFVGQKKTSCGLSAGSCVTGRHRGKKKTMWIIVARGKLGKEGRIVGSDVPPAGHAVRCCPAIVIVFPAVGDGRAKPWEVCAGQSKSWAERSTSILVEWFLAPDCHD